MREEKIKNPTCPNRSLFKKSTKKSWDEFIKAVFEQTSYLKVNQVVSVVLLTVVVETIRMNLSFLLFIMTSLNDWIISLMTYY